MSNTLGGFQALVKELSARIGGAGLGPADQVRVLAALLTEVGWTLAKPDLPETRAALEAHFHAQGDLASALILQGYVLQEWINDSGTHSAGGRPDPH